MIVDTVPGMSPARAPAHPAGPRLMRNPKNIPAGIRRGDVRISVPHANRSRNIRMEVSQKLHSWLPVQVSKVAS